MSEKHGVISVNEPNVRSLDRRLLNGQQKQLFSFTCQIRQQHETFNLPNESLLALGKCVVEPCHQCLKWCSDIESPSEHGKSKHNWGNWGNIQQLGVSAVPFLLLHRMRKGSHTKQIFCLCTIAHFGMNKMRHSILAGARKFQWKIFRQILKLQDLYKCN